MEIKIRNIDPVAVNELDKLAKEEGVSRNVYLKSYLTNLVVLRELEHELNRFEDALEQVNKTLDSTDKRLSESEKRYDKLFLMLSLVTGISLNEVDEYLKIESE